MPRVTSLNGGIIGADNTPSPTKKITTFTSNGCFNRTVPTAQVVVVAGGGGRAGASHGGQRGGRGRAADGGGRRLARGDGARVAAERAERRGALADADL